MGTYEKLVELDFDLSPLGLERRETQSDYFCTPVGARAIYWTGVDGIHYCMIQGFGEMIFVVCPMNTPGDYVYPVAKNPEDFLRLLLACREEAAISQAYGWKREQFEAFVGGLEINEDQKTVHEKIRQRLGLSPMEDAFGYIKEIQGEFDYRKLRFKPEYEEWAPPEPRVPTAPEWKVYFHGNFWGHEGRERAGKEIPVSRRFVWGGENWYIPAVYSCTSGLVVDLCCEVEAERVKAFIEKWNLLDEGRQEPDEEEREWIEAENVLHLDVHMSAEVNGAMLKADRSCGMTWIPEDVTGTEGDREAGWFLAHYGLDCEKAWRIHRFMLSWMNGKKPMIKDLTVSLSQNPVSLPGCHLTAKAGETVSFVHPVTGREHRLTVREIAQEEIESLRLQDERLEYPTHCVRMTYEISPELTGRQFSIRDCAESDAPRHRCVVRETGVGKMSGERSGRNSSAESESAHSIGIIGGADGPTALFIGGRPQGGKLHVVYSSLHFEPVEKVEWRISFREKMREDVSIRLM